MIDNAFFISISISEKSRETHGCRAAEIRRFVRL